jgi:prepilin-type N-terminal cleavage/methylation domain-containing protein
MQNNIKSKTAFTLVELIVVITILAILWTIAFISFQWYSSNARDSVRISDINNIQKWLDLSQIKSGNYPKPDGAISITASGNIILYQWFVWDNVSRIINTNKTLLDPLDSTRYIYSTDIAWTKYQLLSYLENGDSISFYNDVLINSTYAAIDYSKKYVKVVWDSLGIFLNTWSLAPITSNIELVNTNNSYKVIIDNTENGSIIGTWTKLIEKAVSTITPKIYKNCKEIYNNKSITRYVDWEYTIKSDWLDVQAYCDMGTNSWTYTLILDKNNSNLDDYLVWYWDMENITTSWSLTVLKDFSKYKNNWVCYNTTSAQVNCGSSNWPQFVDWNWNTWKAMNFDWINDYVDLWNNLEWAWALTVVSLYKRNIKDTINADWVFWNRKRNSSMVLQKWWVQRYYINHDVFQFTIVLENWLWNVQNYSASYTDTSANEWRYWIWTFNPSNRSVKLYMNWNLKGSTTSASWYDKIKYDSPSTMKIWYNDTNTGYFSWIIDEVRIYNRALLDSEIAALYNLIK